MMSMRSWELSECAFINCVGSSDGRLCWSGLTCGSEAWPKGQWCAGSELLLSCRPCCKRLALVWGRWGRMDRSDRAELRENICWREHLVFPLQEPGMRRTAWNCSLPSLHRVLKWSFPRATGTWSCAARRKGCDWRCSGWCCAFKQSFPSQAMSLHPFCFFCFFTFFQEKLLTFWEAV